MCQASEAQMGKSDALSGQLCQFGLDFPDVAAGPGVPLHHECLHHRCMFRQLLSSLCDMRQSFWPNCPASLQVGRGKPLTEILAAWAVKLKILHLALLLSSCCLVRRPLADVLLGVNLLAQLLHLLH